MNYVLVIFSTALFFLVMNMIPAYAESVTLEKNHSYRLVDDNNATCGDAVSSGTVLTTDNALFTRYVIYYPPIRCDLSVAEWDISSIPSGAVISDVSVRGTGSGTGATSCDVMSFPNQRSSYTDSQLVSRLASNTDRIADNSSVCNSSDMVSLGAGAITYVQSQIDDGITTVTMGAMYDDRSIDERRQSLGTSTSELTITYTISDLIPPTITLIGNNPQTILIGNDYAELGATCNDDSDGDISSNIVIDSSSVNTASVGQYMVTYDCADSASNNIQVTRTVSVVAELVPPTITIPNDIIVYATGEQTIVNIGMATATDNFDPNPTIRNNAPDSFPHGITIVTWTATDSSANESTATQIIMVIVPEDKPADDGLFYFSARANSTVSLYASFEDYSTFTLNCKFFEAGTNSSDIWYNQTATFYVTSHDTANTIYARCHDGSGEQLFQIVEYAEYGIGSGFDSINDTLGHDGLFGVPLPFLFVLVVASIWTGRSAQVGVIITAGTIGIMGMMGLFELSAESWALIVLLVAAGVLMGKKLF